MVKKAISLILVIEFLVIATNILSFEFYINTQVAFVSSLLVILGVSYAYKKMVNNQIEADLVEEKRDLLDEIEDPHELYDKVNDEVKEGALGYEPINETPTDELDLKAIVKEEKAKIKTLSVKSMKHGARGSVSLFRLLPYVFLVLGFIALKNNELLNIAIYLPSLLIGIVVGSISGKKLFS